MKIILMILLAFAGHAAAAQSRIWTREDADREGFKSNKIPETYSLETDMKVNQNTMKMLDDALETALPANLNTGFGLAMQVFMNTTGTIDYLIFDIEPANGYKKDSLSGLIKKVFAASLNNWNSIEKPKTPVQFYGYHYIGKYLVKREIRKADSAVVTIDEAIAIADTLKIKRVFFNQLELKRLPEVVYRFPNLEELYLSDNELEGLAVDFARLPKLKQLHVQNNKLQDDALKLTQNKTLEILNLRENKFSNIPVTASLCKKLSSLWLGGNALSALSNRSFKKLKQVKDLNFYKSQLAVLPKGIKKMKNLEVLDLYYNQFESLPNSLTKLKRLTHLAISYNQLKTLPAKMHRLKKVHTFYAHHNRLSNLPENISKMKAVNILDLGFNWFTHFPAEVASLGDLKELDISSNNFTSFPEQLLEIKKLDKVYLQGNPFVKDGMDTRYERQLGALKQKKVEVFY